MDKFNPSYTAVRSDLINLIIKTDNVVLDVGCATGENGNFLLENNIAAKVVGIELDAAMGEIAKTRQSKTIIGDIEQEEIINEILANGPYDYILLGDILEHLRNPWKILKFLGNALKDDGSILISIPNVQHIDVLIHVFLKGYWPYNERGIFDRTHLRWFTLKNLYELAESSDLLIKKVERKFRYRDKKGSRFPIHGRLLRSLFKNFYTFQYILACQKSSRNRS